MKDPIREKFQLSLKSAIVIYLLVSCNVGLCVYDIRLGAFVAVCLLLSLGVIYFERFTITLVAVCGIVACYVILVKPMRSNARPVARPLLSTKEQDELARMNAYLEITTIAYAIDHYRLSKGVFPDDSTPQKLYIALQEHDGDAPNAPRFLSLRSVSTKDQEEQCLTNPMGDRYIYKRIVDGERELGYVLVDPGRDGLLGGTIDSEKGFIPDGSGADLDNLVYDSRQPLNLKYKD